MIPFEAEFREWLAQNGGYMHQSIYYVQASTGTVIYTEEDLPRRSTVLKCPFSLAITPKVASTGLESLLGGASATELATLSERELICTYMVMHNVVLQDDESKTTYGPFLRHKPYFDTFPPDELLQTPLYFNRDELSLLAGTNLFHATLDRKREWEEEWQKCRAIIQGVHPSWADDFTWQRFKSASTYLSSRAFPSTLLSAEPSLMATKESHPVLLPAIDSLNHGRGVKVSWEVTEMPTSSFTGRPASSELGISLILDEPTVIGQELLNNYGLRTNAELILGYGFALSDNPEDTLVLLLGGRGTNGRRHEIGRDLQRFDAFISDMKAAFLEQVAANGETAKIEEWEVDLEVTDRLKEMLAILADKIEGASAKVERSKGSATIRPEVLAMVGHYISGQVQILKRLQTETEVLWEKAANAAREFNVEVDEYDDDSE